MRIPLTTSLKIEEFIGGKITVASSHVINGVIDQYPDGRWFVTQRPAVNITTDASADSVTTEKGRGIFDWAAVSALYWVNGSEVYKGDHTTYVREAAKSVSNLQQTAGTATATSTAHGYDVGDTVVIAGASPAGYNGAVTVVSAPTADTFTYAVDSGLSNPATGTITARRSFRDGTGRVYLFEVGAYLVILDPDNNVGWYVDSSASTTLVKIEDAYFPANMAGVSLAKGGAVLNGRLYVMDTDGVIYGSDLEDPTSWDALNFLEAELEQDAGVALWGHDQQLVALGTRTIEFFYDAQNPTGSPLAPRTDISYQMGMANHHAICSESGATFFLGLSQRGQIAAYMLDGLTPRKISSTDIDSFLTTSLTTDEKSAFGAAVSIGGRIFYLITIYHIQESTIVPLTTLVFNAAIKDPFMAWTLWELMHDGVDDAPIVDWTLSTRTRIGTGIMPNGDLITMADDFLPQDRVLANGWVEDGWVQPGWVSRSSTEGTAINLEVITGHFDGGTQNYKTAGSIRVVGTPTANSETVEVSWSDEVNNAYGTARSLDLSKNGRRARRCGRFRRRNHKLVTAPSERVQLEGLEMEGEALST